MKKLLIGLLVFVMILSLAGCGTKEKLEEKAGEAVAEKILEESSGGKADVDIDGDKMTIKGKNGEKLTVGGTEWPKSELVKNIPEFKDGTVISIMDTKSAIQINLEKVKKEAFVKYLEAIKKDYAEEAYETTSEGLVSYGANNAAGIGVLLYYADETLVITVTQPQE